jgi:glycosyltransferase involved in cell wall biosynthesis
MKILRVTNSLNFGGIEKVFELHGKYYDKKDYELVFVAISEGGFTKKELERLGYRVIVLGVNSRIPSYKAFAALQSLFKKEKPDVVHTCGAEANFHGIMAAYVSGVKNRIAEEIGIPNHSFVARYVFRFSYLLAHRVIAISRAVASYLVEFEAKNKKVTIIYNPVETRSSVTQPNQIVDKVIFCFLGRLEPIKNCEALIHMIARLEARHLGKKLELWIIGDGTQRQMLQELADENRINQLVKFWGFQPKPLAIMEQAHIFILPSWNEGFGLACIEGIQSGLIVIASGNGGMKEFIRDKYNGFIINPANANEIDVKVVMAINQNELERRQFSERANQVVSEMFSPINYLSAIKNVYMSKN